MPLYLHSHVDAPQYSPNTKRTNSASKRQSDGLAVVNTFRSTFRDCFASSFGGAIDLQEARDAGLNFEMTWPLL